MIEKRKTKSGVKYYARVFAYRDKDGKQHNLNGKARDTIREAKKDEAELLVLAQVQKQSNGDIPVTFSDLVDRYKESKKYKEYAERTKEDWEYTLKSEIIPVLGKVKLKDMNAIVLEIWLESMADRWCKQTFMKYYNEVRTMLKYARKFDWILTDPTEGVDIPAEDEIRKRANAEKKKNIWTDDQITDFMTYRPVMEDIIYPMLILSFTLGLRVGEVCGLKVKDISLRSIRIEQGLSRTSKHTDLKNEYSHREIPIDEKLSSYLHTFCKRPQEDYLFYNMKGNPFNPNVYSGRFRDLLKLYNDNHEVKLPHIPLYNARHSWNTNAIFEKNIDPFVRASVMGHKNPDTSAKFYTRVSQDEMRKQLYG